YPKGDNEMHCIFIELERPYSRQILEDIFLKVRSWRMTKNHCRYLAKTMRRCAAGTSGTFPINLGVHQGSALSPLLFILCTDTVTKDIQTRHPWMLLYADDVIIASEMKHGLEQQVQEWKTRLERFGMKLNIKRTEYL
uniref:ribonuclease H n=1 Tax=Lepisosteus oculatus TaxID=7918 RepID=W5N537_LEPOC